MGTRCDFYVGRGEQAEWIGSKAFDGYPDGIDAAIRLAETEGDYRAAVAEFFRKHDDVTRPEQGWPWPWETSHTTDYAYAFEEEHVYASCFGSTWFPADAPEPQDSDELSGPPAVFPDMSARKNVAYDKRSGLIILGGP